MLRPLLICIVFLWAGIPVYSVSPSDSLSKLSYQKAYDGMNNMLLGKKPIRFEEAVFLLENAFNNKINYLDYNSALYFHTQRILQLANANKKRIEGIETKKALGISTLTKEEQEKNNYKVLLNWAIFTYITDTSWWKQGETYIPNYPIQYQTDDPYGNENWETTMVSNLLSCGDEISRQGEISLPLPARGSGFAQASSTNNSAEKAELSLTKKGNCFSLAVLYYLFSLRLQSEAYLTTAPQHIFIQHKGFDGNYYNVELTTHTFPGSGTIKTYTLTTHEAVMNGIAMRRLNEKEALSLCLVYLAKGYEHKISSENRDDHFILQCAETALQYDSLCLSAMLLKVQALQRLLLKEEQGYNFIELENIHRNLNTWGYSSSFSKNNGNYAQLLSLTDASIFALSIDPLVKQFPSVSPYQAMDNNPINRIDPDGQATLVYSMMNECEPFHATDGIYAEQVNIENDGTEHNVVLLTGSGKRSLSFNDPRDANLILNNVDVELRIMSDKNISSILKEMGALSRKSLFKRFFYAGIESRGGGRMDAAIQYFDDARLYNHYIDVKKEIEELKNMSEEEFKKTKGFNYPGLKENIISNNESWLDYHPTPKPVLFVIDDVIYNNYDAGNFLWGLGMHNLGFDYGTLTMGSQLNAFWSEKKQTKKGRGPTWRPMQYGKFNLFSFDEKYDQQAIKAGYGFSIGQFDEILYAPKE